MIFAPQKSPGEPINPKDKVTWKLVSDCDEALKQITYAPDVERKLKFTSLYLHLKLALLVRRSPEPDVWETVKV